MNNEILFFIIAFVLPHIYYRILLSVRKKKKSSLREKTGLRIHHAHYGMVFLLIAVIFLLFVGKNIYVTTLLGLGLGLMYDELIPSLIFKSERREEMIAYNKSFKSTLILFIILILLLILLSLIYG